MLARGLDSSYDLLTRDEAQRLKEAGYGVYSQCLWTGVERPNTAIESAYVALEAGLLVPGYISLTASKTGDWHIGKAREGIPDDLWLQFWCKPIDVELPGLKIEHCFQAWDALAESPRRIYMSLGQWQAMGRPMFPPDVFLWDASWGAADWYPHGYGGFTRDRVFGWQLAGGSYIQGQYADEDLFEIPDPVPPAPADPNQGDLFWAFNRATTQALLNAPWNGLLEDDKRVFRWLVAQL